LAARGGHSDIIEWLWNRQQFNRLVTEADTFVTAQSKLDAKSPIYYANLTISDYRKETALHLAGENGNLEVVQWLTVHHADMAAKSGPMPGCIFLILTTF
jgi:ankyrin repeat protein